MGNHFKIIVPLYNIEKWAIRMIRSIKLQDYENYECILVNDLSSDNSLEIIKKEVGDDRRFKIIDNEEKKYVLRNIIEALASSSPEKEDIIVILDGDDWFAKKNVLSTLNSIYNTTECWLTYGSYVEYPSGALGKFSKKVPDHVVEKNLFRDSAWSTSHLRSWRFAIWEHINYEESFVETDPIVENNHFCNCWDLAYMFPLLELAGSKIHFIKEVLYVYNRDNPLNVDKLNHNIQLQMEQKIRNMKKYFPLRNI
tara:strand:+ start:23 stop:784 length:762 start_codon:yes stop_codon:yes gene_type:complete